LAGGSTGELKEQCPPGEGLLRAGSQDLAVLG